MIGHTSWQTLKCTHGLLNLICKEIGSSDLRLSSHPFKGSIRSEALIASLQRLKFLSVAF